MKKILTLLVTICLTSSAFALNWQMVGARSMGMGGAGVATAQGNYAQYYNPALLANHQDWQKRNEMSFGLGVQGETSSAIFDAAKKLMDISALYKDLQANMQAGNAATTKDLTSVFKGIAEINSLLNNNLGALLNTEIGFGVKFGNFGVSINSLGSMAAFPVVDRNNILLNDGVNGITFSPTSTSLINPSLQYQTLRDSLKASISNTNIAANLQTMMNATTANPEYLANILLNTLISGGYTYDQIKETVNDMTGNMAGVASLIEGVSTAATPGLYSDNNTRISTEMSLFTEASLGYGFTVIPGFNLGANVKVIEGTMAQSGIFVLSEDMGFGGIMKETWYNKKFSTSWGIDLGAFVNFSDLFQGDVLFNPSVGITAKNINSPKFKRPEAPDNWTLDWNSDDYELKPQYRIGASVNPFKRLTIAADLDLNKNETTLVNYKSRQVSAGVEFLVKDDVMLKLPIRLGINKNLAESHAPIYFTAGFAAYAHNYNFEIGAAIGDGTEKVDNKTIPNAFALSMSVTGFF